MDNYGEPWEYLRLNNEDYDDSLDVLSSSTKGQVGDGSLMYPERIVACVNACAGLSDEELAVLGTGGVARLLVCPQCSGLGYYAEGDTDNPVQVQCEYCWGSGKREVLP